MGTIRVDIEKFNGTRDWNMEEEDQICACTTQSVHYSQINTKIYKGINHPKEERNLGHSFHHHNYKPF